MAGKVDTAPGGTLWLPAWGARVPGLIKLLDRDEDLLAAVLGHEVAHALARHSTEKLRCPKPYIGVLHIDLVWRNQQG